MRERERRIDLLNPLHAEDAGTFQWELTPFMDVGLAPCRGCGEHRLICGRDLRECRSYDEATARYEYCGRCKDILHAEQSIKQ